MYAYRVPEWELYRVHLRHVEELEQPVLGEGHQLPRVCGIQEPAQEPRIEHLGGILFQFNTDKEIIGIRQCFGSGTLSFWAFRIRIITSSSKLSKKKKLYFYCFVAFFMTFYIWRMLFGECTFKR